MKTHDTLVPPATRLALVDFLAFVSLAACIALSVGLVLAGTVLLLSGSAQAAQPEREGGLLLRPQGGESPLAAPLLATDVEIRERLGDSRLFSVGSFTYIGRIEEVKQKMDALFAKLESRGLKGLRIDWGGAVGGEAWPTQVPELYADEPVMVLFSAEKLGGPLTVSAQAGDGSWMARVPVAPASGQNALSVLWARERIDALMDRMRGGVPEDEI